MQLAGLADIIGMAQLAAVDVDVAHRRLGEATALGYRLVDRQECSDCGGTFAVMTRLTRRTDPLPNVVGAVLFSVTAKSDEAWRALVAQIMAFYAEALFNPTWGEQLRFSPGRTLSATMVFHGLEERDARAVWQPFSTG